jgi:Raf kinase inhibitor-like YbhB/YbcL family protein
MFYSSDILNVFKSKINHIYMAPKTDSIQSVNSDVHIENLIITSSAFSNNSRIPKKYTCDGKNISPPLSINKIPDETKSLAIIADDPDAPINVWTHWLMWNIPPAEKIMEGSVPGREGMNDFLHHQYGGPCPPNGTHRYFFRVFALDNTIDLAAGATRHDLEVAIKNHVIGYGHIIGLYSRLQVAVL